MAVILAGLILPVLPHRSLAQDGQTTPAEVAKTVNDFGRRLLAAVIRQDADGPTQNQVVSPVGVASALLMTALGAQGSTAAAFEVTLGLPAGGAAASAPGFAANMAAVADSGPDATLHNANAVWADRKLAVLPDYETTLRAIFGADGVRQIDFAADDAAAQINGWVADQTRGKIASIVAPPLNGTAVALLNALYFKGRWLEAFDPKATTPLPFTRADGVPVTVDMMSGRFDSALYHEGPDSRAVVLPYDGGRYEMVLVLPAPGGSVADLLSAETAGGWADRATFVRRPGRLDLPRLNLELGIELTKPLTALGLGPAFAAADLSLMVASHQTALSAVLHKIALAVNEEGTEAAAATAVIVSRAFVEPAPPFELILDRPFLVALQHAASGTVLFLGQVGNPTR